MGLSLSCCLRDPLVFFLELAELDCRLVRREPSDVVWMAGGLRFGASRGCVRSSIDGGGAVHSRAGDRGDMDIGGGVDGVRWKIEEESCGGREESDERDRWVCV
ncbi:hypothetical protein DY000_02038727 [Brassica cretica]|uniref:Uncharacterized protein n=1 Tax=Brassica cretica TaxID=69181 RepID=A0ABQ7BH16_BRACR|nr:hypothetical protein DY000_02038727 [Brassica cretica]